MGRFRSFLRHSAKPFAFALVAGLMSISLVVSMPGTAKAYDPDIIKAPPRITAGVKDAISGVVSGVRTINPEVWRTAGTAATTAGKFGFRFLGGWLSLAMLAYDTKDTWMPWVADTFGAPSAPNTASKSANILPDLHQQNNVQTLNGIKWDVYYAGSQYQNGVNVSTVAHLYCKNGTTGALYELVSGWATNVGNGAGAYPRTRSQQTYCSKSADPLLGAIVGPYGGDPRLPAVGAIGQYGSSYPGPDKLWTWGNQPAGGDGGFSMFDPLTKYTVKAECIDNSGNHSWVSAESTGDQGAMKVPSCGAAGLGHNTGNMNVTGLRPGGNPSTDTQTLWDTRTAPSDPSTPLCDPGRAGSGCELMVTKDGQPCTTGDPECENWQEQSQSSDPATANRYGCKLGPYTVPLSMCNLLAKAYFPGGAPATEENIDGDPKTSNNNDPNGQPIPGPNPTITSTVPGGAGSAPQAPPGTTPTEQQQETQQCFPGGWAVFNPMWIVDGIKCAFVPKTDIKTRVGTLTDLAKEKQPISWLIMEPTGPGGSGCPNWTINVGNFSWSAVCNSNFTDAVVASRGLIFSMLSVAMVWPLIRSLWYAAIPILRAQPTSGGK